MLIATPDEILQKGLEMGGFNIAQRKVMAEKKKNEKSKTKT
jgi:hypothetical protein